MIAMSKMSLSSLSHRDRRTLLVGVFAISGILLTVRGVPAWLRWERARRNAAAAVLREARESVLAVRSAPLFARTLRTAEDRYFALAPVLVDGEPLAAAGATLTSAVSAAASASNLQVGALQVQTDSATVGEIARLSLRGEATGDVTGVARFLTALEGGTPLIAVREFSLTQADPAAGDDRPEALRIDFLVEALARTGDAADDVNERTPVSAIGPLPPLRAVAVYDAVALARAADSAIGSDPFRLARRPSRVAFGGPVPGMPPSRPRIQIVLDGIIGGPPWRAILHGVPNHDGSTVVATGDTIGGLRVRSIRRDTVVVQGEDTTWTLIRGH